MIDNHKETEAGDDQSVEARYYRAEALEHEAFSESMVLNSRIYPNWIGNSNYFWYIRKSRIDKGSSAKIAKEYRLVDAEAGTNNEAFSHALMARALSQAANRDVNSYSLPISQLNLELTPLRVTFTAFNKRWIFDATKESCEAVSANPSHWLLSPDGKKAVFVRDYNLWIINLDCGEERALTQDGERYCAYGTQPERVNLANGFREGWWQTTEALWSPDSKQLLTVQTDERKVLSLPVTQYVPADSTVRPQSVETKYALPNDKNIAEYRFLTIDVETGRACDAHYPCVLDAVIWNGPFSGNRAWWSQDSHYAYFIDMARGQQRVRVVAFKTHSGEAFVLFEECSDTYIDLNFDYENPASLFPLPETNELIWFSERSGWAHLYLYNLKTGLLKNTITSGDWLVREILYFDANRREVFIQVAGRSVDIDPYYREICRVNIDTGRMTTIASGNHDYVIHKPKNGSTLSGIFFGQATDACSGISPNGHYIVTTRTRADEAPVTELIDHNGKLILTIEVADVSGLPDGWQWPEPVKLLAADGKTNIYGLVFRPSDFSPDKQYPVLDWAMNDPFYAFVPKGAFGNDTMCGYAYMPAAALAELGFITVIIDGRGSCYRSKAFHNEAYGRVHTGSNLEDHIVGIRQLAERYPYMDLDRVGITDTGGSNAPVYGMLAYPDFYKVGTVQSTWDVRLLSQSETYQGLFSDADYESSVLGHMAGNLKGKLLLMHGMLDYFFHIGGVFQLIDALVRENKDFDLVLLPNGGHDVSGTNHYGLRRIWDYLVTHLQGSKPPSQFRLSSGSEYAIEKLQSESQ